MTIGQIKTKQENGIYLSTKIKSLHLIGSLRNHWNVKKRQENRTDNLTTSSGVCLLALKNVNKDASFIK